MTVKLTPEQARVVNSNAPKICILACAGSGKTTTVTHRIGRLINSGLATPDSIAAITFTVLAAEHLRAQLFDLLEPPSKASQISIGTIHSFCFELLKMADVANADNYRVLDQAQQFALLNRMWNEWEIEALDPTAGRADLLGKLVATINIAKMEQISSEKLERQHPHFSALLQKYNQTIREHFYFDFADLIRLVVGTYERHPPFREAVKARFKWIFIDEYQDVDPLQERLITLLGQHANLCVVGDDDQAIYQFRGTDVRNIQNFAHALGEDGVFRLESNRRCRANIVKAATNVVTQCKTRLPKKMVALNEAGQVHHSQFKTLDEEIAFIIAEIQRIRQETGAYRGIAILMRSLASYGQRYLDALRSAGIPYLCKGDRGLLRRPEVRILVAGLEIIAKEKPLVAMIPALFSEVSVPDGDERDLTNLNPGDLKALGLSKAQVDHLGQVLDVREEYFRGKFNSTLETLIRLLEHTETFKTLRAPEEYYNVCQLTEIARQFDEIEQTKRVHRLCLFLKLYGERSFDEATPFEATGDAVHVLTIHQAKGLEYDCVFLPMLVGRRFPLQMQRRRWLIDDSLFDSKRYKTSLDDERRLFYVAATRARDRLYLTCSIDVGLKKPVVPSLFFLESRKGVKSSPCALRPKGAAHGFPPLASYSALEYYLSCPYRYLLLVEYGLASPINPFFAIGKTVHIVAQAIHEAGLKGSTLSDAAIEQLFKKHLRLPETVPPYVILRRTTSLTKALIRYQAKEQARIKDTANVELAFDYPVSGAIMKGRIDLLVKEPSGKYEIVDWKTGDPQSYLRTDFQMQIYALAAREQLGLDVAKTTLYYLESGQEVTYNVDQDFLAKGASALKATVAGINAGRFEATPGSVCKYCECRPVCTFRRS